MDGQPVVDQVGGEDAPEVVGREARLRERRVPLGQVGAPPCEHLGDGVVPEHRADGVHQSLEEKGHWWAVQLLPGVVAGHQRDRAASPCVPANHRGEDVKEVGGNRDDAFAVRLGRSDHEKRDDLPVGTLVLTHAELGQLQQFLDADPGVAQRLDDGPLPEHRLLRPSHVDDLAGRLGPKAKARTAVEACQALIPFDP